MDYSWMLANGGGRVLPAGTAFVLAKLRANGHTRCHPPGSRIAVHE
jgi:hypothetical protein